MDNLKPATNVQLGAAAGFVSAVVLHICQANGIVIPPDVANALPCVFAVIIAHVWDVATGENKK